MATRLIRVADDGALSQVPFSYRGEVGGAIGSSWKVPVLTRSLTAPDLEPESVLLTGTSVRTGVADPGDQLVNAGGSGYYRVSYPAASVDRLAGRLGDLAALERYNLVSDTWAAVTVGTGSGGRPPAAGPGPVRFGRR